MKIQHISQHFSERDLASRWCVSARTVKRLRKSNVLPYIHCGRRGIRYPLSGIEAYEANTHLYVSTTNNVWGLEWRK